MSIYSFVLHISGRKHDSALVRRMLRWCRCVCYQESSVAGIIPADTATVQTVRTVSTIHEYRLRATTEESDPVGQLLSPPSSRQVFATSDLRQA